MKPDRVKRSSEEPVSFTPDQIIVTGISFNKDNTSVEVEFAVLFPESDGKPPQSINFDEVTTMLNETEDIIENDLNITIESVSPSTGPTTKTPEIGKNYSIIAFKFMLWVSLIWLSSIDQPFCAPAFLRAYHGGITGPANCIFHQSESRLPAKYKMQLAEYKIQLCRELLHELTTRGPVIEPFVGTRMSTTLPKRLEIGTHYMIRSS